MKHVVDFMSWPVRVVAPDTSVQEARRQLVQYEIGRLPILDANGQLVGIVSTRDLTTANPADPVSEHMSRVVATAMPEQSVDGVIELLSSWDVGGLPVEIDGHVVGMITWRDLELAGLPLDRPACMLCGSRDRVRRSPEFFRMPLCRTCSETDVGAGARA